MPLSVMVAWPRRCAGVRVVRRGGYVHTGEQRDMPGSVLLSVGGGDLPGGSEPVRLQALPFLIVRLVPTVA